MLAAKLGSLRCALSSEGGPNQSWRPTPGSGAAALIVSRMWRLLFKPICLPWFPAPKPKEETATDRSMNNLGSWLHLSPRDIVFRLAVLAAINVVVFWVPAFYARKYGADAFGTICFAVILCPLSWVLAGLSYPQAWRGERRNSAAQGGFASHRLSGSCDSSGAGGVFHFFPVGNRYN